MNNQEQRVRKGINWLTTNLGPIKWRAMLNPDTMLFANPDKGPLGQLYGDYLSGLKKLNIIGGGSGLGFRSEYNLRYDPAELKTAWKQALKTEKMWVQNSDGTSCTRIIRGLRFTIYVSKPGVIRWVSSYGGQIISCKSNYTSINSAKRAIGKLFEKHS